MRAKSHAEVLALFDRVGEIAPAKMIDGSVSEVLWATASSGPDRPCVYAWVEHSKTAEPRILYIGKTGGALGKRQRQHTGGFMRSSAGKSYAKRLREIIQNGSEVGIHVYYPEAVMLLGEMVSVHSAIEDHLLMALEPKPELNREGRKNAEVAEAAEGAQ